MGYPVVLTKRAESHLRGLQSYLARRFYPENAARFTQRLLNECKSLGDAPHRGRTVDDVRPGARVVGFEGKTAIYFRFSKDQVTILGIRYGGYQGDSGELKKL